LDKSCIGCVTVSESGCCVLTLESTVATSSEDGMRASSEDDDVSAACDDTIDDIDIASDINGLSSFSHIELLIEADESDIVAACEAFNLSSTVFSFSNASNCSAHSSINCASSVMTRSSGEDCSFINGVE